MYTRTTFTRVKTPVVLYIEEDLKGFYITDGDYVLLILCSYFKWSEVFTIKI